MKTVSVKDIAEKNGGGEKTRTIKQRSQTIEIAKISIGVAKITIEGTSPMLMHKFSDKAKGMMDDKRMKRAVPKGDALTPAQEMEEALYRIEGKKNAYGFPVGAFKKCAVAAAKSLGLFQSQVNAAFHVKGDIGGLIPLDCDAPVMDRRIVRQKGAMGREVAVNRTRPRFDRWSATFTVEYLTGLISAEQLVNLYEAAGFSVGLGDYRPEKKGSMGMFRVKRSG